MPTAKPTAMAPSNNHCPFVMNPPSSSCSKSMQACCRKSDAAPDSLSSVFRAWCKEQELNGIRGDCSLISPDHSRFTLHFSVAFCYSGENRAVAESP